MGVLKKVNGGIEKIRWWYCVGSMGERVNGGIEKWRWSGPMGVLNNGGSMGVLKRMNGGIGQGQCGVKVNGGIEKGQVVGEAGVWLWVREEVVLQGCKLYLTGL